MLDYHRLGKVPAKHHIKLDRPESKEGVYYEHCLTRWGFESGYSIAYRKHNPGAEVSLEEAPHMPTPVFVEAKATHHHRHHLPTAPSPQEGHLYEAQVVLYGNSDIWMGSSQPTVADTGLVQNSDGDLLLFFHEGEAELESELGSLHVQRHDYLWIPKGLIHRLIVSEGAHVMINECKGGLVIPKNFRNDWGQLRMDAPYCHRDFRKPEVLSPGEGPSQVLHKRHDAWTLRHLPHHPFDLVGYDGTVYPVAFSIWDYEPKMGRTHLPPPIHTTFMAGNGSFVVCSFVPRAVDDHPEAIPCPYPHSSYDCDEVLWYVEGNFTSRKGVGPASTSFHPAGIPHAPQPGKYEASIGDLRTDEMAVMVDTYQPLQLTEEGLARSDPSYHPSWNA